MNDEITGIPESPFEKAIKDISPYATVEDNGTVTEAYDMSELPPEISRAIGLLKDNRISVLEHPDGQLPQGVKILYSIDPTTYSNDTKGVTQNYGISKLFPHNGIKEITVESSLFKSGTLYVTRSRS